MEKLKSLKKSLSSILILLLLLICIVGTSTYAKSYVFKWTNVKQIEVTAYQLNIRTGPGTSYAKIGWLSQGDIVDVLGHLGSWYVIHTDNDMVGLISSTYTRVYAYHDSAENSTNITTPKVTPATPLIDPLTTMSSHEQEMLNLVNNERIKAGLSPYQIDQELMRIAKIKAADIVDNNYFSHNSPIYGSPFDMLKSFKVIYTYAGENIAGNSTVEKAHTALMYSPGHKSNILNSNFTNIGIGIVDDERYGKVFVQMFITK